MEAEISNIERGGGRGNFARTAQRALRERNLVHHLAEMYFCRLAKATATSINLMAVRRGVATPVAKPERVASIDA